MAYGPELEKASVPQIPDIVAAARQLAKSTPTPRFLVNFRSMTVPEVPIRMPKMSMTMEEGEFNNWLISV